MLGVDNNMSDEPSIQAADLLGAIPNSIDAQLVTKVMEAPNGFSRITEGKDGTADGSMELPFLELSLKRLRSTGQNRAATHDDCSVLRRSDLYHTSAATNQAPTGYGGRCSPLGNSLEAVKMESTTNMITNSNAASLKRGSAGSGTNNDMGSTTNNVFTKPPAYKEKAASTFAVKCVQPSSAFHPVQFQASTQQVMLQKVDDLAAASIGQPREIQRQDRHHQNHVHSMQMQPPDHDGMPPKNIAATAPQCGSSTMFTGPVEGNAANYSVNRSNLGSNHGQNGSSTAVNAVGMNMEIANGIADKSTAGGSGSWVDQSSFAWREAALKKFRQKRKQRNFGKKIRYQSRKRLAEQRPRMHGQFVRQSLPEQGDQESKR